MLSHLKSQNKETQCWSFRVWRQKFERVWNSLRLLPPIQIARMVARMRRRDGRGSSGVTIAWKDSFPSNCINICENQVLYGKNITKAQNFDMLNCHRCQIVKSLTIQHITILDIKSENFEGFFGLAETVHSLSEQQFYQGFDDPVVIDVIIVVNCQKCGKAHRCNSINCEKCDR